MIINEMASEEHFEPAARECMMLLMANHMIFAIIALPA